MNRLISMIMAITICVIGQAQTITGSWKSAPVKEAQNGIESVNITEQTYRADGTFNESSDVTASLTFPTNKGDTLTIRFTTSVKVAGTYTLDGNSLKLKYNYKQAEGKLTGISFHSTKPSVQKDLDEKKESIEKFAANIMEKELRKTYKTVNGEKSILKLSSDSMEYKNAEGIIYHFTRQ